MDKCSSVKVTPNSLDGTRPKTEMCIMKKKYDLYFLKILPVFAKEWLMVNCTSHDDYFCNAIDFLQIKNKTNRIFIEIHKKESEAKCQVCDVIQNIL